MSDKVISSRYRKEIDAFINAGKSARFISQWLDDRGERISHVTISAYRSSEDYLTDSLDVPVKTNGHVENESDLARELLQKAIANLDSPSKTKNYIESFLKMSEIAKLKEMHRVNPVQDMKEDVQSFKSGIPSKKIKFLIYGLFSLTHPYKQLPHTEVTPEISKDYHRWLKVLERTLEPLFIGKDPFPQEPQGQPVKC